MSYTALAKVYDGFFEKEYIEKLTNRYRRVLLGCGVLRGRILDLGCGTGRLSISLAKSGASVWGVDPDGAMIEQAICNANGLDTVFWQGYLPRFQGESEFDAVTASLDVVNHITDEEVLLDTFCAVKRLLKKGGVFVFDVNTEKKFREVYGQNAYVFRSEQAFAAWENDYDESCGICRFTVDVFTKQGDNYQRQTDIIEERCYRHEALSTLLRKAGFRIISYQGMDNGTRHLYIVK